MKIIALRGPGGTGKTPTLRKVYHNLQKHGCSVDTSETLSNGDFRAILKDLKGDYIGIVSQGDYVNGQYSVKNHIKWCESKHCTKTVCACTLGHHKEKIKAYIASFPDYCFIDKTIELDSNKQDFANEQDATIIESYL